MYRPIYRWEQQTSKVAQNKPIRAHRLNGTSSTATVTRARAVRVLYQYNIIDITSVFGVSLLQRTPQWSTVLRLGVPSVVLLLLRPTDLTGTSARPEATQECYIALTSRIFLRKPSPRHTSRCLLNFIFIPLFLLLSLGNDEFIREKSNTQR